MLDLDDRPKFLLSYSTRPLQFFGLIGACIGLLGAAISGWLAYQRLVGAESLSNRPLLLLGILLIVTGVQLVTIGLVAEIRPGPTMSRREADLRDPRDPGKPPSTTGC